MAIGRKTLSPSLLPKCFREKKFTRLPIERVEESVAIGPENRVTGTALPGNFGEDGLLHGIPIVIVRGCELVVPPQFP
jgi:hypothetical protein